MLELRLVGFLFDISEWVKARKVDFRVDLKPELYMKTFENHDFGAPGLSETTPGCISHHVRCS